MQRVRRLKEIPGVAEMQRVRRLNEIPGVAIGNAACASVKDPRRIAEQRRSLGIRCKKKSHIPPHLISI